MALNRNDIAKLYVATFNRAADAEGLNYWDGTGDSNGQSTTLTTLEEIAAAFLASPEAVATFDGDREALVVSLYQNVLGREGNAAEINYWTNISQTPSEELVLGFINGALGTDKEYLDNKAEVALAFADAGLSDVAQAYSIMNAVSADDATVQAAIASINEAAGIVNAVTVPLTNGTDIVEGTSANDSFEAYLGQSAFTGGVANTLSSADKLDGKAGDDSLFAQLVPEFFGASGEDQIDIQARTTSIETVAFEARDSSFNPNINTFVTVDAKDMTGVVKIGSKFSDGDLIIENLTTLTDAGVARNTEALTITMDHTDNFNSDEDASDLIVLFDEDYLLSGQVTSGATLVIRMLNAVQNEAGNNPVEGFSSITFNVGETEVTVDITSVSTDPTQTFQTAYNDIAALINAQLLAEGITTVTASAPALEDAVFSIPVAGFTTGDDAGDYYPIILTNTGPEELTGVNIGTSALQYDTDLNNSFAVTLPDTANRPVTVNIELEKVGRDGEGGNLIVGGKDLGLNGDTDVDQRDGITQFNITVLGDEDRPSNLGIITSTNDALEIVNIASENRTDGSYAALTVRDAFGGTLTTLNANAFLGDLFIGQEVAAVDIDTFTATGGGNVTLFENIGADGVPFASNNANAYSVTTGSGNDNITLDTDSGAQVTVATGAGNDTITVSIDGQDDSGSDLTFASISSTSGNNTVTVTSDDSNHAANITLGGGADTVNGNSVNITVNTGAGNDVIYAENTGDKATATLAVNTYAGILITAGAAGAIANNMNEAQFLNGRTVTVTVAMPEESVAGTSEAAGYINGYEIEFEFSSAEALSTELEFYTAIANAINSDAVVNKLVEARIDSNGNLFVDYKVDGLTVDDEELVQINISDEYTVAGDIPADLLLAVQEFMSDSTITATDVLGAYDDYTADNYATIAAAADNGSDSISTANNIVNGSIGDDVIVLSSNDTAQDTVVFDGANFGNDTIVHFVEGANGDLIDFTAYLDDQVDPSANSNSISAVRTATTEDIVATGADLNLASNEVVIVNGWTDGGDAAESWDAMSAAAIDASLEGTDLYGDLGATTVVAAPANATSPIIDSILMIENAANDGEYKVFNVKSDSTAVAGSQFTVTLVGTIDFGETYTQDDNGAASNFV